MTYLALALVLALLPLLGNGFDISSEGVGRVAGAWVNWLITPIHVLKLTTNSLNQPPPSNLELLGRLLLAIPFVTAALAMRNYVKDDHRRKDA